uniref:Uncharacterized protein n=1 Tax=Candidatus Kentrum sp. LFY TaxID=2126342 RepID=A0A450WDE1_9GAMM|nr:MAG: hypothetical protein BECKLFY1418C_GA0070996_101228 [Candidatus Kentron sp. LFY]
MTAVLQNKGYSDKADLYMAGKGRRLFQGLFGLVRFEVASLDRRKAKRNPSAARLQGPGDENPPWRVQTLPIEGGDDIGVAILVVASREHLRKNDQKIFGSDSTGLEIGQRLGEKGSLCFRSFDQDAIGHGFLLTAMSGDYSE